MAQKADTITVQNVNTPGRTTNVNAEKYREMKQAFLRVLPESSTGLTQKEIQALVQPHLADSLFPGGSTSGWWAKTVHLDLEAKGMVVREHCKPLRWHRA